MRVLDNLVFFGAIRGLGTREARRRAEEWLARFGLAADAGRRLQELSKGNQQKVQFLATVLHRPDLLLLDEPFDGLDPLNLDLVRGTILDLARGGTTVILSTHRMDEVERLCSHLTLVHRGRALVEGPLDDVKRAHATGVIRLDFDGDPSAIDAHPAVERASGVGGSREILLAPGADPSAFLASVATRVRVRRFEIRAPSLHEIFVRLVEADAGRALPEAAR
jgi:ABC-2 type transport system ATP-binding protein